MPDGAPRFTRVFCSRIFASEGRQAAIKMGFALLGYCCHLRSMQLSRLSNLQAGSDKAKAVRALALGAAALGALAFGAVALGALAIGRLVIGRARIRRLEIDELVVRHRN
jgi:hypothetical protein